MYFEKHWVVKSTMYGPVLYDEKGDAHGTVSANKLYKDNLNLFEYFRWYYKENPRVKLFINKSILEELAGYNLVTTEIYFTDKKRNHLPKRK